MKVCQFRFIMESIGGGERVMKQIAKSFGAPIYTFLKTVKGKEIRELGSPKDKHFVRRFTGISGKL